MGVGFSTAIAIATIPADEAANPAIPGQAGVVLPQGELEMLGQWSGLRSCLTVLVDERS